MKSSITSSILIICVSMTIGFIIGFYKIPINKPILENTEVPQTQTSVTVIQHFECPEIPFNVCDLSMTADEMQSYNAICGYTELSDINLNGIPDECDDSDNDGIVDAYDNCPLIVNLGQEDSDGDSFGDTCDTDVDDDGLPNRLDICPADPLNDINRDGICENANTCN